MLLITKFYFKNINFNIFNTEVSHSRKRIYIFDISGKAMYKIYKMFGK